MKIHSDIWADLLEFLLYNLSKYKLQYCIDQNNPQQCMAPSISTDPKLNNTVKNYCKMVDFS